MSDLASSSIAHNSGHAIMSTQQQHTMDLHLRNGEVSSHILIFKELGCIKKQHQYLNLLNLDQSTVL